MSITAGSEYHNSRNKLNTEGVKFQDEEEAIQVLKDRKIKRLPINNWIKDLEYNSNEDIWYSRILNKERVLHDFSLQQLLAHVKCSGAINMIKTLQVVDDKASARCCNRTKYLKRKQKKNETDADYKRELDTCQHCGKPKSKLIRNNEQMEAMESLLQRNWETLRDLSTQTSNVYAVEATDILGSSIRAFPTEGKTKDGKAKGYYYLPDWQAMELARAIVPKDAEFLEAKISPVSTEFSYNLDTKTFEGEDYQLGLSISNSEFKFKSYTISALIYQQVCSNGLIIVKGQATERVRHNKEELKFNKSVKTAFKSIISKLDVLWEQFVQPLTKYNKKICKNWEEFIDLNFLKFKSKKELLQIKNIANDWEYNTTPSGIMKALTNFSSNKATEERRQYINVKANDFLMNMSSIVNNLENSILI